MLPEEQSNHPSYLAVNPSSYNHGHPVKIHLWVQQWHKCHVNNQIHFIESKAPPPQDSPHSRYHHWDIVRS